MKTLVNCVMATLCCVLVCPFVCSCDDDSDGNKGPYVRVTTLEPEETAIEGMVLKGKAEINGVDPDDIVFHISIEDVKLYEATFNAKDNTFSVTLPMMEFNRKYTYFAAAVSRDGELSYKAASKSFVIEMPELPSGAVDLGLSVKWSSTNVGASTPYEPGYVFQWAVTKGHVVTDLNTILEAPAYKYGTLDCLTKYCVPGPGDGQNGKPDGKTVVEPEDDAATADMGGKWRTPRKEEWTELIDKCKFGYARVDGIRGCVALADNGNAIFIPSYDCYHKYWTSSLDPERYFTSMAAMVDLEFFDLNEMHYCAELRNELHQIRAVCE